MTSQMSRDELLEYLQKKARTPKRPPFFKGVADNEQEVNVDNGIWVKKVEKNPVKPTKHKCAKPRISRNHVSIKPGSVWVCEQCKRAWKLTDRIQTGYYRWKQLTMLWSRLKYGTTTKGGPK